MQGGRERTASLEGTLGSVHQSHLCLSRQQRTDQHRHGGDDEAHAAAKVVGQAAARQAAQGGPGQRAADDLNWRGGGGGWGDSHATVPGWERATYARPPQRRREHIKKASRSTHQSLERGIAGDAEVGRDGLERPVDDREVVAKREGAGACSPDTEQNRRQAAAAGAPAAGGLGGGRGLDGRHDMAAAMLAQHTRSRTGSQRGHSYNVRQRGGYNARRRLWW